MSHLNGFPREYSLDLRSDSGETDLTLAPGTSEVSKVFRIAPPKATIAGSYMCATTLNLCLTTGFDQAASGGSAVNEDELYRAIGGVEIFSPVFGTILAKEAGAGPLLKHIQEFMAGRYQYDDGARAQVAAADGDTQITIYVSYHIAPKTMVRPRDFALYLPWLDQTTITFFHAVNTAADGASTGAVFENNSTTVRAWVDYVVDSQLEVPSLMHWKRYAMNAGSGTDRLLSVGAADGMTGVNPVTRHFALAYVFNKLGMGGCTTSDNITSFTCEALGITRISAVDSLVRSYTRAIGNRPTRGGVGSGTTIHDRAGNPYTMGATVNGRLNDDELSYLPIIAPTKGQKVSKCLKFNGDLEISKTYTSTPATGQHVYYSGEIRTLTESKIAELLARAGKGDKALRPVLADGRRWSEEAGRLGKRAKRMVGVPFEVVE